MADESDPTGEPLESQSNESKSAPAEEYKVGPGRPPADKRWKKGGPSPNPRGRPRKEQSMLPDVRKVFEQALNKKVLVSRGDRKVLITKVEIGFEQLLNQFAKGEPKARRDVMEIAEKLGIDFSAKQRQAVEEALAPNYQTILDSYVARRSDAADVAASPRVLAPPALLDDDDSADPDPTPPSPPLAKTKPEPEPPQKPGVDYPKPFSQMTESARRAWYSEWCAEKAAEEQEKQRMKEKAKAEAKENQAAPPLDQTSRGAGRPPPGGFSVTTGKPT